MKIIGLKYFMITQRLQDALQGQRFNTFLRILFGHLVGNLVYLTVWQFIWGGCQNSMTDGIIYKRSQTSEMFYTDYMLMDIF